MKRDRIAGVIGLVVLSVLTGYFVIGHVTAGRDAVPSLAEGFGILESEIELRHVHAGWQGSAPLTIINGADKERTFSVSVEQANPNKMKDGYEPLPEDFHAWLTVPDQYITIPAGGHHECTITIAVPSDAPEYRSEYTTMTLADDGVGLYTTNQFEVRIRVTDMMPEGLVSLAIEAKWYIITAEDS